MVRPLEPSDSALLGGDRHVDEPIENRCAPFYERGWHAGYAKAVAEIETLRADVAAIESYPTGRHHFSVSQVVVLDYIDDTIRQLREGTRP